MQYLLRHNRPCKFLLRSSIPTKSFPGRKEGQHRRHVTTGSLLLTRPAAAPLGFPTHSSASHPPGSCQDPPSGISILLLPPPQGSAPLGPHAPGHRVMEHYEEFLKVGEGAFGAVFRARDRRSGDTVAVKRVARSRAEEGVPLATVWGASVGL